MIPVSDIMVLLEHAVDMGATNGKQAQEECNLPVRNSTLEQEGGESHQRPLRTHENDHNKGFH